jgi:hypothetical protein
MLEFLEAAADWADRHERDVVFVRDDVWSAIIRLRDGRGAFQATVDAPPKRRVGRPKKGEITDYRDTVFSAMESAVSLRLEERHCGKNGKAAKGGGNRCILKGDSEADQDHRPLIENFARTVERNEMWSEIDI